MPTTGNRQTAAERYAAEYYDRVLRFCKSKLTNDSEGALNCTQETFVTYLQKADTVEESRMPGWLYRTARNIMLQYLEDRAITDQRQWHYQEVENGEELLGAADQPEEADPISDEELAALMDKVLAQLTEGERELYDLGFKQTMKQEAIGRHLGIPTGRVAVRLFRLREKLRNLAKKTLADCRSLQK